jgi:peptidoglycan hydrolase-like protein with peptidoglycan-binding domain
VRRFALTTATATAVALALAASAGAINPQVAGLQVALRANGFYAGPIDGIAGPLTVRGVRRFQRRVGLPVDGRAGLRTRAALGPFGRPLFGRRTLRRHMFGWDVSVLQFLLARRGFDPGPIGGYMRPQTVRALRRYQRSVRLAVDGVAGPRTMAAMVLQAKVPLAPGSRRVGPPTVTSPLSVRAQLDRWSAQYGVDGHLVRALAWMESGYSPSVVSKAGARGILQLLPSTWKYVETVLLGRRVPHSTSGQARVGVVFLRHLLIEFRGNERLALAAWYQGERSIRKRGPLRETRLFVANVLALRQRM